jgi:hypothetical protein
MKVNVDVDLARMKGKNFVLISRKIEEDNYLNPDSDLLADLL